MNPALRKALTWHYFIPHSGAEAAGWHAHFLSAGGMDLCLDLEHALELAKTKRCRESVCSLVGSFHRLRSRLPRRPSSLALVLLRHYLAVHAYVRYAQGEYARAARQLRRASVAALRAIDEAPFLLMLASSEYEFCLHQARIARQQRQWRVMIDSLQSGRAMVRGDIPLCRLPSGREVHIGDVDAAYRRLEPRDALEDEALRLLTDAALRQAEFEHAARGIEILGTVVVPFEAERFAVPRREPLPASGAFHRAPLPAPGGQGDSK